jgi:hypothetical protein
MGNGFSLLAHYTWSKGMDTCTTEVVTACGQQDPLNRNASYAPGDNDRTHVAVISYVYAVPFFKAATPALRSIFAGWQLAGIHRFQTGVPLTILTGSDVSLTGIGYDRPNVLHSPDLSGNRSKQQEILRWFDPTAFAANQPRRFGNAGRNIIRDPGIISWDLSIHKDFPIFHERRTLQFRTDFLNIMNHANLGEPSASLASPGTLGMIGTQSGGPRVIQLAFRVIF